MIDVLCVVVDGLGRVRVFGVVGRALEFEGMLLLVRGLLLRVLLLLLLLSVLLSPLWLLSVL